MARISKTDIKNITKLAKERGLEPVALLAVVHVESGGMTGSMVDGRFEPIIRFEGHYFDKRLTSAQKIKARKAGLASPKVGAVANPSRQSARYKLLERAMAINKKAALESVSWGIGQVMGAHWKRLGYRSVDDLVKTARSGVAGQVALMLDFIDRNGLRKHLMDRNWVEFARRYNGSAYAKNRYDEKIQKAYRSYRAQLGSEPATEQPSPLQILRRGARGAAVRTLQSKLHDLGFPLAADGIFGPLTEDAVRRFQRSAKLRVDGIYGSATASAMKAAKHDKASDGILESLLSAWKTILVRLFGP